MPNFSILDDTKNALNEIKGSINSSLKQSFEQYQQYVLDLNRKQMFDGTKSDDTLILPPYAESTISYKIRKGQPYDRVTLKDTGAFYNSLILEAFDDEVKFKITSALQYGNYLITRYSSSFNTGLGSNLSGKSAGSILGLNTTNKTSFLNDKIIPILKQNIDDIIAKS